MQFGCGAWGRRVHRIPLYGPLHSVVEPEIAGELAESPAELIHVHGGNGFGHRSDRAAAPTIPHVTSRM